MVIQSRYLAIDGRLCYCAIGETAMHMATNHMHCGVLDEPCFDRNSP